MTKSSSIKRGPAKPYQQRDHEIRLLRHLAEKGNIAMISSQMRDRVILSSSCKGISLGRGSLPASVAHSLLECQLLSITNGNTFIITDAGREALVKLQCGSTARSAVKTVGIKKNKTKIKEPEQNVPKAGPGRRISKALLRNDDNAIISVHVNDAESPLAWLYKRRDRNGEPFIDEACFEAGERLRRDMTLAQIMPRVTSSWTPVRSNGEPATATEAMVSARQRLHKALDSVDSDYAGVLLDICGFLKGIEEVERERQWPPRSGKVVLKLALRRLASHYGLKKQARGPENSKGIRTWLQQ